MKNSSKSKRLLIILTPIVLLVIVVGISYAYWRKTVFQESLNKVDTLKCLNTTITDITSAINLEDEYPISNLEGMTKTPYTFKITNMCNVFIEADIALEVLSTSTLNAQYVRSSLNLYGNTIDNSKILTNYPLGSATIEGAASYTLQSKILIMPNDSTSYDLRLWIDEPTTTEQGANKIFNSKIVVTVSPTAMPVNLTINMPGNLSGVYESNFAGAIWNHKLGGLTIKSVTDINQNINLTNKNIPEAVNLATYIMSLGEINSVYNEPATDYRYEGENPNNYISFNNELWRIIGVFSDNTHGKTGQKLVKIIRNDSLGVFNLANNNFINNWGISSLYYLMNQYYYNGINEENIVYCYHLYPTIKGNCDFTINGITNDYYRNMIENVTWKLGGIASSSYTLAANVSTAYTAERGTSVYVGPSNVVAHIGMIYPSDYGYSVPASLCARTTSLHNYNTATCGGNTWLRGKGSERTLTPDSSDPYGIWSLDNTGAVYYSGYATDGYSSRPVLYLKSNTMKLAGTGTSLDPYTIFAN